MNPGEGEVAPGVVPVRDRWLALWRGHPAVALAVIAFTVLAGRAAFPGGWTAEAVFVFLVPLLLWLGAAPVWRRTLWVAGLSAFLLWAWLLVWLVHVTVAGWLVVSLAVSLFFFAWLLLVRWLWPRLAAGPLVTRLVLLTVLAAAWVIGEWLRTWVLTGFPWLPLAAALWERPLLLQMAAWTGAYGVSFLLVFFNAGVASFFYRLARYFRGGWRRLAPEFYLALVAVLVAGFGIYRWISPETREWETLFRVGFVQPAIAQDEKWDDDLARRNLAIIREQSELIAALQPDLLLWPEAVLPVVFAVTPEGRDPAGAEIHWGGDWAFLQDLALVGGVVTIDDVPGEEERSWRNAVFAQSAEPDPERHWYFKRKLVPFGEYIPYAWLWPWMEKVVPIGEGFVPGERDEALPLRVLEESYQVGILLCYEDIFPGLARRTARAGVDFFVVNTNNAWFGEWSGAYQHAAHSVLRAVETRRPFLRVGNAGWSGWIDEFGGIREVLTNEEGTIYFRGGALASVERAVAWSGRDTFYTRHGDWLVAFCGLYLLGWGGFYGWRSRRSRSAN